MEYVELAPGPHLRPWVRRLWGLRARAAGPGGAAVERIVPDGCPEIVIHRGDRFRRLGEDGAARMQERVLVVGQLRRALRLEPSGVVDLIGIRFEPGGLHALVGVPMRELLDRDVGLDRLEARLRVELTSAAGDGPLAEGSAAIETVLSRWLGRRGWLARGAGLVGAAVRVAARRPARATVAGVAAEVGVGTRALERAFAREVGIPPKLFLRIARLQSVVRRLDAAPPVGGWAEVAVRHGYADQPHLIRDFRLLVGTTPRRWLAERTALAGCFERGTQEMSPASNPGPTASGTMDPTDPLETRS